MAAIFVSACFLATACSSAQNGPKASSAATPSAAPSTSTQAPAPTSSSKPGDQVDISRNDGYDRFTNWKSNETVAGLEQLAGQFGLPAIYYPKNSADASVMGVAALSKYCVVVFSAENADINSGKVTLFIFSRYNRIVSIINPNVPLGAEVKTKLDTMRKACTTGLYTIGPSDIVKTNSSTGTVV